MHYVADFLPHHIAKPLARRLALHQRLLDETRKVLPSSLRDHCQLCWIGHRGQLVVQVTGQEYAAQIRFFLIAILEAVRKVTSEEIRQVLIRAAIPVVRTLPSSVMTTPSAAHLLAEAADACSVPEISKALSRLAVAMTSRCERKGNKPPG